MAAVICGDGGGRKSNGDPCQRPVTPGYTRCCLHGSEAPAAKIKADIVLQQARLPACEALYTIIERWQQATCVTCGYPSGDTDEIGKIIHACKVILDRTGMGPSSTVFTKQSDGDVPLNMLTDQERATLVALIAQVNEIKQTLRNRLLLTRHGHDTSPKNEGPNPVTIN